MPPTLEQLFTLPTFNDKDDTFNLNTTKGGVHRMVVPHDGAFISCSGLEASILPGDADWLLLEPTIGVACLDIRAQARSEEGDIIYGHCTGMITVGQEIEKLLQWSPRAKTTAWKGYQFVETPVLEVSSEGLE